MEYIRHEEVSYCTVLDLSLSQDELEVYESCMRYILENLSKDKIYDITGTFNLDVYIEDIKDLFNKYVRDEVLPEKYKDIKKE